MQAFKLAQNGWRLGCDRDTVRAADLIRTARPAVDGELGRKLPRAVVHGLSWVLLAATAAYADSPGLTAIASFTVATGDHPVAPAMADNVVGRGSALYTTTAGGAGTCYAAYGCGSVVQLAPPATEGGQWAVNVLHVFTGPDGEVPYAGLMMDTFGALYGATRWGGAESSCTDPNGCGVVFRMTPVAGGSWSFATLYNFKGGTGDGRTPGGNPIFDTSGALYGTTAAGGPANAGIVYKLTPPAMQGGTWTETVLHVFAGPDGARPRANLVFDTAGALYGTTQAGGAFGRGAVFKLTPPAARGGAWAETILHAFTGSDGSQPFCTLLFDSAGALYGTTWKGGRDNAGTVFKLTPPASPGGSWTESVYDMPNGTEGATMQGGLVRDTFGLLYGATNRGGTGDCTLGHCGTVFAIVPPATPGGGWTHTVLASFNGSNGGNPVSTPSFLQGALYGTAEFGGTADLGVVYQFHW